MSYWAREIAGWLLILVGLIAFYQAYDLLLRKRIFEAVPMTFVGFIVCPTSWTEDEDFDVVIDGVRRLEDRIRGWEASGRSRRSHLLLRMSKRGTIPCR